MTFWEHLEELRKRLWYIILAMVVGGVVCFVFKEVLFSVVLAPKPPDMQLINVELTQQFLVHLRVSLLCGLLLASPYVLYQLFAFVAPGLYQLERRLTIRAVASGYVLFILGVLLNYFVLFPFTVRFLGGYQVSAEVTNTITLTSYTDLLLVMSFVMGVVFELPVLCWLLAKIGVLKTSFMRHYRRHAVVVILILSAIITPTGDPFTLLLVAAPIYALWELSILVVRNTEKHALQPNT